MTIQGTGPIKISRIATEFTFIKDYTSIILSDYYRGRISSYTHTGTAGIPTDTTPDDDTDNPPLSFSNFYNASSAEYFNYYIDERFVIENGLTIDLSTKTSGVSIVVVIADSSNTECLDFLDNLYDNNVNGWKNGYIRGRDETTQTSNVIGIGHISSRNPSIPAISITNVPADSSIRIHNFGFIVGAGGDGAEVNTGNTSQSAQNGGTGGDGIYVDNVDPTSEVLIENWGTISGGAGGGGAGGQGGLAVGTTHQAYTSSPLDYYDSSSYTGSLPTISNANFLFDIEEKLTVIETSGSQSRFRTEHYGYKFWLTRLNGNIYSYNYYNTYNQTAPNWSNWVNNSDSMWNYIIAGWSLGLYQDFSATSPTTISPETIIGGSQTIDGVTFTFTSPVNQGINLPNDFTEISGIPFPAAEYQYVKNATDVNGVLFSDALNSTYADTFALSPVATATKVFKKGFKTLTVSNVTSDISHGGAGGAGANFSDANSYTVGLTVLNNPSEYGDYSQDKFGTSIDVDGSYLVVGALEADSTDTHSSSGIVYVFDLSSTTPTVPIHILDNPNTSGTPSNDQFGKRVSISGNYIVANAVNSAATFSGHVYVYDLTSSTPTTPIHTLANPAGSSAFDVFGGSPVVEGNYVAVASTSDNNLQGKVYIYDLSSSTPTTPIYTIANPNNYNGSSNQDFFGVSIAINGDILVASASNESVAFDGDENGVAYVFDLSTPDPSNSTIPTLLHTIENPNNYSAATPNIQDYFGNGFYSNAIAIDGNIMLISAMNDEIDSTTDNPGVVHVFDLSPSNQTPTTPIRTLENPNPISNDLFGISVALKGNYAVIGTDISNKIYIFDITSGNLIKTLSNPNIESSSNNDEYGRHVAISSDYVITSAPEEKFEENLISYTNSGNVYITSYDSTTGSFETPEIIFPPSTGLTVADTIGITTPNAIYHPAFKYGQGGQGGSGNYWSITPGDTKSLTLKTSTAASGENGTSTNGFFGGTQGASGTAINTSLSNVTITNH